MDDLEAGWQAADDAAKSRLKAAQDWGTELDAHKEVTETNPQTRGYFTDVAAAAVRGPVKAVRSVYSALSGIAESIVGVTGDVRLNIGNGKPLIEVQSPAEARAANSGLTLSSLVTGKVDGRDAVEKGFDVVTGAIGAPQTTIGSMTEGTTQFLTGLIPIAKGAKALKLLQGSGRAITAARGLALGATASGVAFEGHEANLANLVESFPALKNPVTDFLATDEEDGEVIGRLKNAVVDAGGGAVFEGLLAGLRTLKGLRKLKAEPTPEATEGATGVTPEGTVVIDDGGLTLSLDEPTVATRSPAQEITHDSRIKLETPEQETIRLVGEPDAPKVEPSPVEVAATKLEQKAETVKAEATAAVEQSKPKPFKEMSPDERYADMRARLGISDEKLEEFRTLVKDGKIKPEKVADLIGANPDRIDWLNANDPEDMVGMWNTLTRIMGDVTGEAAGSAPQTLESIAKNASEIGGSFDDAMRTFESTRNLAAHVQSGRAAVMGSSALLQRLAKKISTGTHVAQDLLDFVSHDKRHALLQIVVRGTRAEIGRALRVMREAVGVSESALKIANGRRLRQVRKAGEAADKAKAAGDTAKQARKAKEEVAKVAEAEVTAKKAADDAEVKATEAEAKVTSIEGIIAKHTEVREKAARAAAKRAADELKVDPTGPQKPVPATLAEQLSAADDVVRKNRLEGEHAAARDAAKSARSESKAARAAHREAEKVTRAAERKAKDFEDFNNKAADQMKGADVALDGDTKLQFAEVQEALRGLGMSTDDVVNLAKEVARRETSVQINQAARTGLWAKFSDRISGLYINNILSGIPTTVVNITSGFYKIIESAAERYGAAAFGGDRFDRIAAHKSTIATFTSWRAAWKVAGKAWSEGLPQTDIMAKAEVAIRGGTGETIGAKILSAPSRVILTTDEFFKHIFYQQELTQRAVEVAASAARLHPTKVMQDKVFASVLKETLENPADDLVLDAIESARYNTFQSNLESAFAKDLIRLTNGSPISKLVIPFVKTPVNIIKQGLLERSPLALLRVKFWKEVSAGGRAGRTAALRAALGTAAVGTVWHMADSGRITGSNTGRAGSPNSADLDGAPPYSIKIGDTWYQYNRLDPMGTLFGLTADLRLLWNATADRNSNEIASDDASLIESFGGLLGIVSQNITDKTFFKGVSDFVDAAQAGKADNTSVMKNYVYTLGTNLVPFSALLRNIAKSHDGYAREAFTFTDKLLSGIPGASNSLPLKNDILGRPITQTDRIGADWASPFLVGKDDPDPVVKAFAKLEMSYRMPDKDIAGIKLDAEQYSQLTRERGQFIYGQLSEWISNGEWADLTRVQQTDMIRRWSAAATQKAEASVLDRWPKVGDAVEARVQEVRALKAGDIE